MSTSSSSTTTTTKKKKKMAKEDPNNGGEGGDNKLEWLWKRVHKSTHIYRALNIIRRDVQEF